MAETHTIVESVLISASDALEHASRSCGDRVAAKQQIADLLKDGRIRARAARQWTSRKPSLTAAWRARSRAKFDTDVALTRWTWERSRFWADDLDMWRWSRNRFVLTAAPAERIILEGIQLDRSDLAREVPLAVTGPSAPPPAKRNVGGRPIKRDEWHDFWWAVLVRSQKGELTRGFFQTQEELRLTLLEDITDAKTGEEYLSEGTIKPHVQQIWDNYVRPFK